jgi:hypothetical protein
LQIELGEWQTVETKLKAFIPREDSMKLSLQKAIPEDKQKIHGWEAKIQAATKQIEAVGSLVDFSRSDADVIPAKIENRESRMQTKAREISNLRSYAAVMSRDVTEADDLRQQITSTERGLEGTGSTKTTEEVQAQMTDIDKQM